MAEKDKKSDKIEKLEKPEKVEKVPRQKKVDDVDDITIDLIKSLNKEFGSRVAYNLSEDTAPTIVKRWVPTGSIQLDYAIRNAIGGGYPEGRIIEIASEPSLGKSHLAYLVSSIVQSMGGLVVYIDTENATPLDKLQHMGINVSKRFVYCDTHCTEEVLSIIESTVIKAKSVLAKDIPIVVIWDSVAGSSPKAELDGDYDQNTMGLQARVLSRGMRKLVGVIGQNNITLICINQLRSALNVRHGDPNVTPGGKAIPFHASVRIRLSSGTQIKDKQGNVIGIHVIVTIKKNKVAPPFRKFEMDIHFGKGIIESDALFDECRKYCARNEAGVLIDNPIANATEHKKQACKVEGTSGWKVLTVSDAETGEVLLEKSFHKPDFTEVMKDAKFSPYVMAIIDAALTRHAGEACAEGETPETDEDEAEDA